MLSENCKELGTIFENVKRYELHILPRNASFDCHEKKEFFRDYDGIPEEAAIVKCNGLVDEPSESYTNGIVAKYIQFDVLQYLEPGTNTPMDYEKSMEKEIVHHRYISDEKSRKRKYRWDYFVLIQNEDQTFTIKVFEFFMLKYLKKTKNGWLRKYSNEGIDNEIQEAAP